MVADRTIRALLVLLIGFALTHGVYQAGRALLHSKQGLDLAPGFIAARLFMEDRGAPVYDRETLVARARSIGLHGPAGPDDPILEYAYAPWLLPVYAPLAWLPWDAARMLWFALGLAASMGAAALAASSVAPAKGERRHWVWGGVGAACLYFPLFYGLMAGQGNDLPFLAVALSLWLLRRDRPALAGLALAPAVMWKIFPGILALFFIARREWRALAGLFAGCAALALVTLPLTGVGAWSDWIDYLVGAKGPAAAPRNHSIAGNVALLLSTNSVAPPLLDRPSWVAPVSLALSALAATVALAALLAPSRRGDPRYAAQFGAALTLGVLLTPLSWEHYGVFLLPAFFAAFASAASTQRRVAMALLGAAFAVWATTLQMREEYTALARGAFVLMIPAKLYATLVLLGICAYLARVKPPEAAGAPDPAEEPGS